MIARRMFQAMAVLMAFFCANSMSGRQAEAADEAVAASGRPLNVAVFVNSRTDRCYSRGYKAAIERLTRLAVADVNRRGGASRRPINVKFFDNRAVWELAARNVEAALQGEELLAMIGLSSSQRSKQIFEKIGDKIGASKVPLITRMSVSEIFAKYDNVFSTSPSQEVERIPVMVKFIKANGFKSIAFLGREGSAYIDAIGNGLVTQIGSDADFLSYHRIRREEKDGKRWLNKKQLAAAIAEIKANPPAILAVAVGSSLTHVVLEELTRSGVELPLFVAGRFTKKLIAAADGYPHPLFGITFSDVPEVHNDRIFNVLSKGDPEEWQFAGERVAGATGECPNDYVRETYSLDNLRAVSRGAQFADMVRLVAASAAKVGRRKDIGAYRRQVLEDLASTYSAGRGAFKGTFENWSFHPRSRVRAETPFVVILPGSLGRTQLTQQQFLRLPNKKGGAQMKEADKLKQIDTIYLDVDLIRTHSVDNNRKTFFAEFYLALRVGSIDIGDIAFTNALLDPKQNSAQNANGRQISIEVLHEGGPSDAYPHDMRMYKVSGLFRFTPDFSSYPFDRQQFSIDLQPKSGDKTFIVQPPPTVLRDGNLTSEGWLPEQHYVSYVEDFVPVIDAFTHTPSIVPFYKTRFVWQMTRETTDYYIRVIVPLAFILIVAYLSIFIPKTHLEAIITLQVTALLSAVALYLSLPQIDTDSATISDRIFMFDYMMVSLMIVISILRINARMVNKPWIQNLLAFIHIVIVPAVLISLVLYITKSDLLKGFVELPGWKLLGIG